ncbi:oligosaccharide flippase family protein [Candidatus Saccharibacteria bacterium]|nr:oligosaccharide flippase family protein [Candidatus Saccharibacteria bacterium]
MWRKIGTNTVYQLIGKGVSVISSVIIVSLLTRSLGGENYGEYVLVTSVPAFLYLFVDFGLNAIFLREISSAGRHSKRFGSFFALRAILSMIAFLTGLAFAFIYTSEPLIRTGMAIALTTVFTQGAFTSFNALFQHSLRYNLSALAAVVSYAFAVSAVFVGFLSRANFLYFVGVWTLASVVLAGASLIFAQKLSEKPIFSWDKAWVKSIFKASLPIGLMLVFAQINARADVFLLRALDSAEAVGIYRLAYSVFENILPIPIFFVNALYPVMLRDRKLGIAALFGRLKKSLSILVLASIALGAVIFVFAPWVIYILGGEEFAPSFLVLRLLAVSFPLFFVTAPLQWTLITVGKERVLPVIYAVAAVVNVLVNVVFIPYFSYLASVAATILSELLILAGLVYAISRFRSKSGGG